MGMYVCKNKTNCDKADRQEPVELALGAPEKCPECGMTMKPAAGAKPDPATSPVTGGAQTDTGTGKSLLVMCAFAAIAIAAVGSTGYAFRCKLPMLGAKLCTNTVVKTSPATAIPVVASRPTSKGMEQAAKNNCEHAVEMVELDRLKICNRANAITLTNSGALAATLGNLEDAEHDYKAAIAKDPDFDGVYVNYAALKVRQGKNSEAVDLIESSLKNGFTPAAFFEQDPVFAPLFADAIWGKKLRARIGATQGGQGTATARALKS